MKIPPAILKGLTELRAKLNYDNVMNVLLLKAVVMAEALLYVEQETEPLYGQPLSELVDMLTIVSFLGRHQHIDGLDITFDYTDFIRQVEETRCALIVQDFDRKALERLHVSASFS